MGRRSAVDVGHPGRWPERSDLDSQRKGIGVTASSSNVLVDYYRCPESFVQAAAGSDTFGPMEIAGGSVIPALDPRALPEYFRRERYALNGDEGKGKRAGKRLVRNLYYLVREFLPVSVRRHLQRAYLKGWEKIRFPHWPVDRTVEMVLERLLWVILKTSGRSSIPFIWFWPRGATGCVVMTHDVETSEGRDACSFLMDLDDSFGIKASFQLIPEKRYHVPAWLLDEIRRRGFEVNIHDLNHDGHLFDDRQEFLRRARKINEYARAFCARGFRSAVLYRNLDWYEALEFSYDMSVPNVAHLDPQRGGCCTVMPYFVGSLLEIPLTTTQDYSLFHILGNYSTALWKVQVPLILEKNGLVSFNVHPDYIAEKRANETYRELLAYLNQLQAGTRVWVALPGEVDEWWRQRSQMELIQRENGWEIEGPGSERACVAHVRMENDRVIYKLEPSV